MMGDTIKYKGGYKYQLAETYQATVDIRPADTIHTEFIHLTRTGLLMIGQGYAWDGPSGPAIDTKNFMRGSLIHDALYQLMREGHLPKTCRRAADVELRRACAEDGMSWIRCQWVYWSVCVFASSCADPQHKKPVLEAP